MFADSRKKVHSSPFSDFFRNVSSKEKRKIFDKVIKESVAEQQAMLKKAELRG